MQLPGEESKRGHQHERAVDRPAEQADARHIAEGKRIERRIAAQRIEQRHEQHASHQPIAAAGKPSAGDAEPQDDDGRGGADEEVVERAVGGADGRQRIVVRPPVVLGALERAHDVGDRQGGEVGRIERGIERRIQRHRGSIGECRELHGEQQRNGKQRGGNEGHGGDRRPPLAQVGAPVACREHVAGEHRGEHEGQQQRLVVAADRQGRGDHPERARQQDGAAIERDLHQQQRQRKEPVADDDAAVLQPARRRAAEHEDGRGQDRGRHRPAGAPTERTDGEPADQQVRVDDEVESTEGGRRIEQRPQHEGRREDQRLRVGDARVPAVVVGVPERRVASVDGGGEEAEECVELVLGVPGHDRVGDDPAAGGDGPDRKDRGEQEDQVAVAHPHRRHPGSDLGRTPSG